MKPAAIWSFLFLSVSMNAQVFVDRSDLLASREMHSAVPVGIADMNGDGLDDLITMNAGEDLVIQYQTPDPARPFVRYTAPVHIDGNAQNDIIIGDFNNDGANDIFTVGSYDRVKVLYAIPGTYEFTLTYIVVVPFFSQGASAGDFNGDGWLDVVILNDNGLNYSMINDGTGQLVHQDFFDFVTVPPSDNSGNYGSLYTDFDMDGDSDFYIAKCRQGVNNPNDPRRINVLFVNDGNNQYTQNAAAYGLASGRQTWTADFGDIDNDGDLDCFMTQHDVICELFENIDNDTFINITTASGLNIGGVPLQGMFRDFDNDGYQDILVSGDRVDYYRNQGDKTFVREDLFGNTVFGTFALGDLNHDGYTDIYASRVIPFNNPDLLRNDILYLNQPNDNHFLALHLRNSVDAAAAIGATASLYGPWGIQVREVKAGEQYGVSNGHALIFGLGAQNSFDSLVIRWPDGSRQVLMNLAADQHWFITKHSCSVTSQQVLPLLEAICDDDSLILSIDSPDAFIEWNTGVVGDSILITSPGIYYATLRFPDECTQHTFPVEVIQNPDSINPVIYYEGNFHHCSGEVVTLSAPFGLSFLWSDGQDQQTIQVGVSGDYFAVIEGYCFQRSTDTIHLDFITPDEPVTTMDTFSLGEQAFLLAEGDSIVWYDTSGIIIGTGPELVLNDLTTSTRVYAQNLLAIEGRDFQLGPIQQQGNTKYNAPFVNGGLIFEVYEPIVLHDLTVFTDSAGTRIIEISNGIDFFYELQVEIDSGKTVIDFGLELPPGVFTIQTNSDLNNLVFGANSPYLWRSSDGVLYPYEINGVASITNSTFGEDFYYYFYDWHISTADKYCSSELVPVSAILDVQVSVENPANFGITISPNPSNGVFQLQCDKVFTGSVEVFNLDSRKMDEIQRSGDGEKFKIDLSQYPAGTYFLRITHQEGSLVRKIIKL